MNSAWHKANRMPKNASVDEKVDWHRDHALNCGCRRMPEAIRKILEERAAAGGPKNHQPRSAG